MESLLITLEATYRQRALPPGSARYWSWLFAAADMRNPLMGLYALRAEWSALMDSGTERGVAEVKLAWWQDEIGRLAAGEGLHPISRFLASLPGADRVDFTPLRWSVAAAAAELEGAPLELGADLDDHAAALWALPLDVVAGFIVDTRGESSRACTRALAAGCYLAAAIEGYRRDCRHGRVPFPVDELLAAGIQNDDLVAVEAPAHLAGYLDGLRSRARKYFAEAAGILPAMARSDQRHLLVLAALGPLKRRSWRDMLLAWHTARRAAATDVR